MSLTVSPAINQAPSFTAGPSQTDEDAGAQTVAGWATAPKPPPNGWSAKGATNSPNTFDALMGIAPPAGTIGRPAIGGTRPVIQGTLTLNGNNVLAQGFNLSTGVNTGINDAAGAISGVAVNQVSVTSTTGAAVNLSSFGGAVNLTSVASSGGANGILLQNTTGSFTVNGDGANTSVGGNASGGTISGMVGADGTTNGIGVYLNNTQNVTLRRMAINGTNQNYAIKGFSVNGFTLEYSTVGGTNGTATSLASPENYGEGAIHFGNATTTGVVGNVTFTNNNISGGTARNLSIVNTVAGTTTLTVKGNTFGAMQNLSGGNQSFAVEARASAGVVINTTFGGTNAGATPRTLPSPATRWTRLAPAGSRASRLRTVRRHQPTRSMSAQKSVDQPLPRRTR